MFGIIKQVLKIMFGLVDVGHLFSIVVWNQNKATQCKKVKTSILEVLSLWDNYSRTKVECNRMEYTKV
jgi:hypothetical protein